MADSGWERHEPADDREVPFLCEPCAEAGLQAIMADELSVHIHMAITNHALLKQVMTIVWEVKADG